MKLYPCEWEHVSKLGPKGAGCVSATCSKVLCHLSPPFALVVLALVSAVSHQCAMGVFNDCQEVGGLNLLFCHVVSDCVLVENSSLVNDTLTALIFEAEIHFLPAGPPSQGVTCMHYFERMRDPGHVRILRLYVRLSQIPCILNAELCFESGTYSRSSE